MKKLLLTLLAGMVSLSILSACAGDTVSDSDDEEDDEDQAVTTTADPDEESSDVTTVPKSDPLEQPTTEPEEHIHVANAAWDIDKDNHFHLCSCGAVMDSSAHTFEDDICTVCQCEFYAYDDGSGHYNLCNEYGDTLVSIDYDAEGALVEKMVCEYTYDADGNKLTDIIRYFDADGTVTFHAKYEMTYNEDGNIVTERDTYFDIDGAVEYYYVTTYTYNDQQFLLSQTTVEYDADGNEGGTSKQVYTLDENGDILTQMDYEDDVLVSESYYDYDEDGWTYLSKTIVYYDNDEIQICEYNEYGDCYNEYWVDADGNLIDRSEKFNADAAAPLIGTWSSEMDIADFMGTEELEFDYSCMATITMTFTSTGDVFYKISVDTDEYKNLVANIAEESLYAMYMEDGMSRDEADAAFYQETGMTIPEYVQSAMEEDESYFEEMLAEMNQEETGVYYVDDGILYIGDNWNSPLDGGEYTIDNDTFKLMDEDLGEFLQFTKTGN